MNNSNGDSNGACYDVVGDWIWRVRSMEIWKAGDRGRTPFYLQENLSTYFIFFRELVTYIIQAL